MGSLWMPTSYRLKTSLIHVESEANISSTFTLAYDTLQSAKQLDSGEDISKIAFIEVGECVFQ